MLSAKPYSKVVLNRLARRITCRAEGAVQTKGLVFTDSLADHPAWR